MTINMSHYVDNDKSPDGDLKIVFCCPFKPSNIIEIKPTYKEFSFRKETSSLKENRDIARMQFPAPIRRQTFCLVKHVYARIYSKTNKVPRKDTSGPNWFFKTNSYRQDYMIVSQAFLTSYSNTLNPDTEKKYRSTYASITYANIGNDVFQALLAEHKTFISFIQNYLDIKYLVGPRVWNYEDCYKQNPENTELDLVKCLDDLQKR